MEAAQQEEGSGHGLQTSMAQEEPPPKRSRSRSRQGASPLCLGIFNVLEVFAGAAGITLAIRQLGESVVQVKDPLDWLDNWDILLACLVRDACASPQPVGRHYLGYRALEGLARRSVMLLVSWRIQCFC